MNCTKEIKSRTDDPCYQMSDKQFLQWMADRMNVVYGEADESDMCQRLRKIANLSPDWIVNHIHLGVVRGNEEDQKDYTPKETEAPKGEIKQTPEHKQAAEEDKKLYEEITALIDHDDLIKAFAKVPKLKTKRYQLKVKHYLKSAKDAE